MKFMFPTVYRVTQKDFYARPYTTVWPPVVARQISERYSSCELLQAEGPTAWPPRSPDLTSLDFFFAWAFIKDVEYRRKVRDLADLIQSIIEAVELITAHMLVNTWQELEYRLDICRATTAAHIKVYGRA